MERTGDQTLVQSRVPTPNAEYTLRVVYQDGSVCDHQYPNSDADKDESALSQLTERISWYAEGPHGHNEGYGGVISMHVTLSRPCQDWQRI